MPRDSNGVASLVPSYRVVNGQPSDASQHNPPLEDIAEMITGSLPRNGLAPMLGDLRMGGNKLINMAPGVAPTDSATLGQVAGASPVGAVIDFAGSTAPSGWLLCFGQAVSRSTYAALFSAIGTAFGSGDGSTTFNIPDTRGRVVAGKDDMGGTSADRLTSPLNGDALGAVGGNQAHTLTIAQIPAHSHTGTAQTAGGHVHNVPIYSGGDGQENYVGSSDTKDKVGDEATTWAGDHTHTLVIDNAGGGSGHNNVQPTIVLNKIIRTGV